MGVYFHCAGGNYYYWMVARATRKGCKDTEKHYYQLDELDKANRHDRRLRKKALDNGVAVRS